MPLILSAAASSVSLAHPGGNVTGISSLTSDIGSKRVELLKEIVPDAKRVAVLWNSGNVSKVVEWKETICNRAAFRVREFEELELED